MKKIILIGVILFLAIGMVWLYSSEPNDLAPNRSQEFNKENYIIITPMMRDSTAIATTDRYKFTMNDGDTTFTMIYENFRNMDWWLFSYDSTAGADSIAAQITLFQGLFKSPLDKYHGSTAFDSIAVFTIAAGDSGCKFISGADSRAVAPYYYLRIIETAGSKGNVIRHIYQSASMER
jgi:hypothetical protein